MLTESDQTIEIITRNMLSSKLVATQLEGVQVAIGQNRGETLPGRSTSCCHGRDESMKPNKEDLRRLETESAATGDRSVFLGQSCVESRHTSARGHVQRQRHGWRHRCDHADKTCSTHWEDARVETATVFASESNTESAKQPSPSDVRETRLKPADTR